MDTLGRLLAKAQGDFGIARVPTHYPIGWWPSVRCPAAAWAIG